MFTNALQHVRVSTSQGHRGAVLCLVVADARFNKARSGRVATGPVDDTSRKPHWVFTGGADGDVRRYDAQTAQCDLALYRDHAEQSGGIVAMLLQQLRCEESHPRLKPVLLVAEQRGDVICLDPSGMHAAPLRRFRGPVRSGATALVAMRDVLFVGSRDGFICEFFSFASEQRRRIPGHSEAITALLLEGDAHKHGSGAQRMISASADGTLRFVDVPSSRCQKVVKVSRGSRRNVETIVHVTAFLKSSANLVCGCSDGTVRLFNIFTGAILREHVVFSDEPTTIRCVALTGKMSEKRRLLVGAAGRAEALRLTSEGIHSLRDHSTNLRPHDTVFAAQFVDGEHLWLACGEDGDGARGSGLRRGLLKCGAAPSGAAICESVVDGQLLYELNSFRAKFVLEIALIAAEFFQLLAYPLPLLLSGSSSATAYALDAMRTFYPLGVFSSATSQRAALIIRLVLAISLAIATLLILLSETATTTRRRIEARTRQAKHTAGGQVKASSVMPEACTRAPTLLSRKQASTCNRFFGTSIPSFLFDDMWVSVCWCVIWLSSTVAFLPVCTVLIGTLACETAAATEILNSTFSRTVSSVPSLQCGGGPHALLGTLSLAVLMPFVVASVRAGRLDGDVFYIWSPRAGSTLSRCRSWLSLSDPEFGWHRDRFVRESRFFALDRTFPVFGFAVCEIMAKVAMVIFLVSFQGIALSIALLLLSAILLYTSLRRPTYMRRGANAAKSALWSGVFMVDCFAVAHAVDRAAGGDGNDFGVVALIMLPFACIVGAFLSTAKSSRCAAAT